MSIGAGRYRIDEVHGRHFVEAGRAAGLRPAVIRVKLAEVRAAAEQARGRVEATLPAGFPEALHASVQAAIVTRLARLDTAEA